MIKIKHTYIRNLIIAIMSKYVYIQQKIQLPYMIKVNISMPRWHIGDVEVKHH